MTDLYNSLKFKQALNSDIQHANTTDMDLCTVPTKIVVLPHKCGLTDMPFLCKVWYCSSTPMQMQATDLPFLHKMPNRHTVWYCTMCVVGDTKVATQFATEVITQKGLQILIQLQINSLSRQAEKKSRDRRAQSGQSVQYSKT